MKLTINIRSLLPRILVMLACAIVVSIAFFELKHRYNFGHFVPYGLHVDVFSEDRYIGISGQTKMYRAELSNFTLWPVKLDACDYITDDFGHGTKYPYAVQHWNSNSGSWQTVSEPNREDFCRPAPLSTIEAHPIPRRLWPGMSVEVMDWEATGARDAFRKGDRARFVVFKKLGDWRNAVASEAFIIEDDVRK